MLDQNLTTDNQKNDELAPMSNTGVKNKNNNPNLSYIHLDTIRISGKIDNISLDQNITETMIGGFTDEDFLSVLVGAFQENIGVTTTGITEQGSDFYKYKQKLCYTDDREFKSLGHIAWGGEHQRGSYLVNLTGEFCEYLELNNLNQKLKSIVDRNKMVIKRVDLAHDDYDGIKDLNTCLSLYEMGGFKLRKQPKIKMIGDFFNDTDPDGRTVYIGSRTSGKMLRVYEKGKQLGDKLSRWVRWEVEFKDSDKTIPSDILVNSTPYFKGAYPCFDRYDLFKITEHKINIKTIRKSLDDGN